MLNRHSMMSPATPELPMRRRWQASSGVQSSSCQQWKYCLPSTLQVVAVHSRMDRCSGPCHWTWRCI
eukprot:10917309-Prorocentrum_lima.AAC.1